MTVLELINKAREDNDFDVIGAINVKEYLPVNEKREVIDFSPSLADKLARNTAINTIDEIASEIANLIQSA